MTSHTNYFSSPRANHSARHHWLIIAALSCAPLLLTNCGGQDPAVQGESLLAVAEQGDVSALTALLKQSAPPDYRNSCQWTPLMKAALNGHKDVLEQLLAAGAQVDAVDIGNYTALLLAASNDHADCVALLLDHGAMINHQETTEGFTALIWAAKLGHLKTVELLLKRGADVTLPDQKGRTALDWAREQKHAAVEAALIAAGK